ncbi:uncharacterized protein LOC114335039 [Diabrotica virgifera virgifera]|uniref:Uncharacterized protein LOC114335039 n=1 Tax=Diabrotica virgifera virgifera TaxID=50390 RepID=A0A6P7G933_DIAVI|nr:uncharacterized protein LOC114335039 [Diabrotica virgifera virgifera]
MKSFNELICILYFWGSNLSQHDRQFLRQVHESCQHDPKTYCDEHKLRNLQHNINDRQVGIHMKCMAVKAGLMKHHGDLDITIIKIKISSVIHDQGKVNKYVHKCAHKAEYPEKTANMLWLCFIQNGIDYYHRL